MRKPLHPISRPVGLPHTGYIEWSAAAGEYAFYPRAMCPVLSSDMPVIQMEIIMMNSKERAKQMDEDRREKVEPEKFEWIDPKERLPGIGEVVVWKMRNTGNSKPEAWTTSGFIRDDGRISHSSGCGTSYPSIALGWQPLPKLWIAIEHSMPGIYEPVEWRAKNGKVIYGDCGKSGIINTPTGSGYSLHDVDAWRKK